MAEVLVQVGEFRPEHVQVLMDPAPEALLRAIELNGVAVDNNRLAFSLGRLEPGATRSLTGSERALIEDFARR